MSTIIKIKKALDGNSGENILNVHIKADGESITKLAHLWDIKDGMFKLYHEEQGKEKVILYVGIENAIIDNEEGMLRGKDVRKEQKVVV